MLYMLYECMLVVGMYMPVQCACYRIHEYRNNEGLPNNYGIT